jgi:undecaprenyl-diphosphatase
MLEGLLEVDTRLFLYLNNLGTTSWDGFWLLVTNKYSAIPLYLLLIGWSFRTFGVKTAALIVVAAVLLVVFTDQVTNVFKYSVKRLRPCHNDNLLGSFRLVKETCGGYYSYFSGHASNSMAVAVFFGLIFKRLWRFVPVLLVLWSLLVGYSRIYIGVHYPLDVLSGFAFGGISGALTYLAVNRFNPLRTR